MKTSVFLAASGAILAMATPLNVEKRKIETEVVIEWKTVYVTEGALPSVFAADPHHHAPGFSAALASPSPAAEATAQAGTVAPAPEASTEAPSVAPTVASETTVEPATEAPTSPTEAPTSPTEAPASPTEAPASPTEAPASPTEAPASPTEASATPTVVASPNPPAEAPPASSTQPAQAAQPTDYASTAVYHHNIHRLNFSAPALEWSDTYASYAAQTAATCVFAHNLTPGGGGYGQNLALYGSSNDVRLQGETLTVAQAITDMWFNGEVSAYPTQDLGKPNPDMSNFEAWGHFSQVVWVSSEQVGCATQYCPAGTIYPNLDAYYTVCDYYPPGNMGGGYGANVLASLNEPTVVV